MNFLFWRSKPAPAPAPVATPVPFTRPEMVIVQYFNQQKAPVEKVMPLDKYEQLLQLAETLKGDMSIALNNHLETLP